MAHRRRRKSRSNLTNSAKAFLILIGLTTVCLVLLLVHQNRPLVLQSFLMDTRRQKTRLAGSAVAQINLQTQDSKRRNAVRQGDKQYERPVILPSDFEGLQLLTKEDSIYRWASWDEAPIVVESHKLLFFTIPKVGCTVFKQLMRRMYGYKDWQEHNTVLPHHPLKNGLKYLYHFKPKDAEKMLTDPSWTRAIFFRDPKERLLSAYLDKVLHNFGKYIRVHCCHGSTASLKTLLKCQAPVEELPNPLVSFAEFLSQVVPHCTDPHWRDQSQRLPEKMWPYINFVGHMDSMELDTKRLLQKMGAWQDFGASGWGSGAIFSGDAMVEHATNAKLRASAFYSSPDLIQMAENLCKADYNHSIIAKSLTR